MQAGRDALSRYPRTTYFTVPRALPSCYPADVNNAAKRGVEVRGVVSKSEAWCRSLHWCQDRCEQERGADPTRSDTLLRAAHSAGRGGQPERHAGSSQVEAGCSLNIPSYPSLPAVRRWPAVGKPTSTRRALHPRPPPLLRASCELIPRLLPPRRHLQVASLSRSVRSALDQVLARRCRLLLRPLTIMLALPACCWG